MMLYSLLYYLTCCTAYLNSAGAATVSSQAWPAVQLKGELLLWQDRRWLGSSKGSLHRGLDLVLEAAAMTADWQYAPILFLCH